jgi:hypothetical protein
MIASRLSLAVTRTGAPPSSIPGATLDATQSVVRNRTFIVARPQTAGAARTKRAPGGAIRRAARHISTAPPMLSPSNTSLAPGWRAATCCAASAASATIRSVPAQPPRSGVSPKPR